MYIATIEWKSRRYPRKTYTAILFTPGMHADILALVLRIKDYHLVVDQIHVPTPPNYFLPNPPGFPENPFE